MNIKLFLGIIVLLWKKKDKDNPENQRPICLLSVIFKLIQRLILNRITKILTSAYSETNYAFKKGGSTQKLLFLRKHALTCEKYYNDDVKIIEEESDIRRAYPSRQQVLTNNVLIKLLGHKSKLLNMIL